MKTRRSTKALHPQGTSSSGQAVQRFKNSESVRTWRVLMALNCTPESRHVTSQEEMDAAFDQVVHGFKHGEISIDYRPEDSVTLDIPKVGHPSYLEAMVYWTARMDCKMATLSEAHALLGRRPSVERAHAAISRLEREEAALRPWLGTAVQPRQPRQFPKMVDSRPVFQSTVPYMN